MSATSLSCSFIPAPILKVTHEHTHLTGAHFCKQLLLSDFRIRLMDECDLLPRGDPSGNELFPDVVVDGKGGSSGPVFRVNGSLQRVKLRAVRAFAAILPLCAALPLGVDRSQNTAASASPSVRPASAVDVVDAQIDLAVPVVRQVGVDHPLVEAQLRPSEVIFSILSSMESNRAGMYLGGAFRTAPAPSAVAAPWAV